MVSLFEIHFCTLPLILRHFLRQYRLRRTFKFDIRCLGIDRNDRIDIGRFRLAASRIDNPSSCIPSEQDTSRRTDLFFARHACASPGQP